MQLTYLYIKVFTLDCCAYVSASHISIVYANQQSCTDLWGAAVNLALINPVLLFLENLSVNTRHFQRLSEIQSTYNK